MKVIHCPGHTPGSICLYDEANRILFSGDHLLQDRIPNVIIETIFGRLRKYKSMVSYFSSLERMKSLSVDLVYPGHGNPFNDISSAINNIFSHLEIIKRRILEVMAEKEMQPAEIAREIAPNLTGQLLFLKMSDVLGMLEVLEEEGVVESILRKKTISFRLSKKRGDFQREGL